MSATNRAPQRARIRRVHARLFSNASARQRGEFSSVQSSRSSHSCEPERSSRASGTQNWMPFDETGELRHRPGCESSGRHYGTSRSFWPYQRARCTLQNRPYARNSAQGGFSESTEEGKKTGAASVIASIAAEIAFVVAHLSHLLVVGESAAAFVSASRLAYRRSALTPKLANSLA